MEFSPKKLTEALSALNAIWIASSNRFTIISLRADYTAPLRLRRWASRSCSLVRGWSLSGPYEPMDGYINWTCCITEPDSFCFMAVLIIIKLKSSFHSLKDQAPLLSDGILSWMSPLSSHHSNTSLPLTLPLTFYCIWFKLPQFSHQSIEIHQQAICRETKRP